MLESPHGFASNHSVFPASATSRPLEKALTTGNQFSTPCILSPGPLPLPSFSQWSSNSPHFCGGPPPAFHISPGPRTLFVLHHPSSLRKDLLKLPLPLFTTRLLLIMARVPLRFLQGIVFQGLPALATYFTAPRFAFCSFSGIRSAGESCSSVLCPDGVLARVEGGDSFLNT